MNRRDLFKNLLVAPVAVKALVEELPKTKLATPEEKVYLPIECDLSLTGLEQALYIGMKKKLGKPRSLVIAPALLFISRELLWHKRISPDALTLELVEDDTMNPNEWWVRFDSCLVGSRGCW